MSASLRKYLVIFSVWSLYGLMMAVQTHYRIVIYQHRPSPWPRVLVAEFSYAYLWFAVTPAILYLARRFPISMANWGRPVLIHALAAKFCGILTLGTWNILINPLVYAGQRLPMLTELKGLVLTEDFGLLNYSLVVLALYV